MREKFAKAIIDLGITGADADRLMAAYDEVRPNQDLRDFARSLETNLDRAIDTMIDIKNKAHRVSSGEPGSLLGLKAKLLGTNSLIKHIRYSHVPVGLLREFGFPEGSE